VEDRIKHFGKLQHYDLYGNPYTPEKASELPLGLTADKVIEQYMNALGGKENLLKVKDIRMNLTTSVQGANVEILQVTRSPNLYMSEVKMGGNILQKEDYNGESLVVYHMGQKVPVTQEQGKEGDYKAVGFAAREYEKGRGQTE